MGGHILGNLGVRVRHIISYTLSPYEQKAFAGYLSRDLPNMFRRLFNTSQSMLPGLGTAAAIYYFTNKKAIQMEIDGETGDE